VGALVVNVIDLVHEHFHVDLSSVVEVLIYLRSENLEPLDVKDKNFGEVAYLRLVIGPRLLFTLLAFILVLGIELVLLKVLLKTLVDARLKRQRQNREWLVHNRLMGTGSTSYYGPLNSSEKLVYY